MKQLRAILVYEEFSDGPEALPVIISSRTCVVTEPSLRSINPLPSTAELKRLVGQALGQMQRELL